MDFFSLYVTLVYFFYLLPATKAPPPPGMLYKGPLGRISLTQTP